MPNIRPSSDIRNNYPEISRLCKETGRPVYITVNGKGDTAINRYTYSSMSCMQGWSSMKSLRQDFVMWMKGASGRMRKCLRSFGGSDVPYLIRRESR